VTNLALTGWGCYSYTERKKKRVTMCIDVIDQVVRRGEAVVGPAWGGRTPATPYGVVRPPHSVFVFFFGRGRVFFGFFFKKMM
jgi:hypothetical protein